jgi:hypothetical protein
VKLPKCGVKKSGKFLCGASASLNAAKYIKMDAFVAQIGNLQDQMAADQRIAEENLGARSKPLRTQLLRQPRPLPAVLVYRSRKSCCMKASVDPWMPSTPSLTAPCFHGM